MKFKRFTALIILTCMLLCSCGKETVTELKKYKIDEQYYTMPQELFGFGIALNGTVMTFPMEYGEFIKYGYELTAENLNKTLKKDEYSIFKVKNVDNTVEAYFANFEDEEAKLSDCIVCGVVLNISEGVSAELPQKIQLSVSTEDDIIKAYGKPDSTDSAKGYDKVLNYKQSETSGAELYIKDGTLYEIYLHNVINSRVKSVSKKAPDEVKAYKAPEYLSDKLSDFTFYLYGTNYTMPLPVKQLIKHGFVKAWEKQEYVPANTVLKKAVKLTGSNRTIVFGVKNVADYPTTVDNCFITSIQSTSSVKLDLTLANGCRVGSTTSNFLSTFKKKNFTSITKKGNKTYYVYNNSSKGILTVVTNEETGYISKIKLEIE